MRSRKSGLRTVVPACNVDAYIRAALGSLHWQGYPDFDGVVNAGTSGDIAEVVDRFQEGRIAASQLWVRHGWRGGDVMTLGAR